MRFTNKFNLPQYLVDWLKNDDYDYNHDPSTISTTSLLKPLRARILTDRHGDKLEIDVADLIASRYGNAIHDSIERIDTPGTSKELRVTREIEVSGMKFTVTGKYDLLVQESDGTYTLRDIKTTSVWSYIYGGKDDDYRGQLSIYRWLLSQDKSINPLAYIDFYFTDWQGVKARADATYPRRRIQAGYEIDLLSLDQVEAMIRGKLEELVRCADVSDNELPYCTNDELWAEEDSYAVYKIGNKRATKVCDSEEEATKYKDDHQIKGFVQHRPGKVKRCKYCSAAPFCNQFKELQEQGLIDE